MAAFVSSYLPFPLKPRPPHRPCLPTTFPTIRSASPPTPQPDRNKPPVQSLWRKELQIDGGDQESFLNASILHDIQRLTKQRDAEKQLVGQRSSSQSPADPVVEPKNGLRGVVDMVLVADFFFILFALAWFVAGLAQKTAFDDSSFIDAWFFLWPSVFQPALGVLMAAAIITALPRFFPKR